MISEIKFIELLIINIKTKFLKMVYVHCQVFASETKAYRPSTFLAE